MRVIWSSLRSDNCVGDRTTVMMIKGGFDSVHRSRRLYIIAEGHVEY